MSVRIRDIDGVVMDERIKIKKIISTISDRVNIRPLLPGNMLFLRPSVLVWGGISKSPKISGIWL